MSLTRSETVSQLVFKSKDFVLLLMEIAKFFESHPNREKYIDDVNIIWDNHDGNYLATIYISDVKVD